MIVSVIIPYIYVTIEFLITIRTELLFASFDNNLETSIFRLNWTNKYYSPLNSYQMMQRNPSLVMVIMNSIVT